MPPTHHQHRPTHQLHKNESDVGAGPGGHGGGGGGCPIVRLYSAFETRDALVLELEVRMGWVWSRK